MYEHKPLRLSIAEPFERSGKDRLPIPLRDGEVVELARVAVQVVVDIESLVQAEAGVQSERAHEGGGEITCGPEDLGQSHLAFGQPKRSVVAHAVGDGVAAGEERCMGRKGDGYLRESLLENYALLRQPIESRRRGCGAVGSKVVRAQRIHADKEDVGGGHWPDRCRAAAVAKGYPSEGQAGHQNHEARSEKNPRAVPGRRLRGGAFCMPSRFRGLLGPVRFHHLVILAPQTTFAGGAGEQG